MDYMSMARIAKRSLYSNRGLERAVFWMNDKIRTVDAYNKKADRQIKDFPNAFIGVYTDKIKLHQLAEDLEYYFSKLGKK